MDNWITFCCFYCHGRIMYLSGTEGQKGSVYVLTVDGIRQIICVPCQETHNIGPAYQTEEETTEEETTEEENTIEQIPEDERIYVSTKDYTLFDFCRKSWLCKLIYRLHH